MSVFDRLLNLIGAGCAAVAAAGEGGVPIPSWLKLVCIGIAFVAPASAAPLIKRNSLLTPKADKRGQIADAENPKK